MCGRITLTVPDVEEVARLLEARVLPSDAARCRPRYNAAPTDEQGLADELADGRLAFVVLTTQSADGGSRARPLDDLPSPGACRDGAQELLDVVGASLA